MGGWVGKNLSWFKGLLTQSKNTSHVASFKKCFKIGLLSLVLSFRPWVGFMVALGAYCGSSLLNTRFILTAAHCLCGGSKPQELCEWVFYIYFHNYNYYKYFIKLFSTGLKFVVQDCYPLYKIQVKARQVKTNFNLAICSSVFGIKNWFTKGYSVPLPYFGFYISQWFDGYHCKYILVVNSSLHFILEEVKERFSQFKGILPLRICNLLVIAFSPTFNEFDFLIIK